MTNRLTLKQRELLILLLYAPDATGQFNVPVRGRTRLVKMVFLFREEVYDKFKFDNLIEKKDLPDFEPWKFGPFSRDVYQSVEFLQATDFIKVEKTGETPPIEEVLEQAHFDAADLSEYDRAGDPSDAVGEFEEETFSLTDKGCRYADQRIWAKLSDKQVDGLTGFKDRLVHAPLIAILKYVYANYPNQATKSEIKDEVLG